MFIKYYNNLYYNKKLYFKNNYFTHRDFHASNIMVTKKRLSLIDSQDAIIGNPLYDVASLIDDVRIKVSFKKREMLFNKYVCTQKKVNALKDGILILLEIIKYFFKRK